jgi:hypothetical protein
MMKVKFYTVAILSVAVLLVSLPGMSQKANGRLVFGQGQVFDIRIRSTSDVTQEAMGQAITINVKAELDHRYTVTNSTESNTTLHHEIRRVAFNMDGMGQTWKLDSDNPKELEGELGAPVKEILDKEYDIVVDPRGTVLMARPEEFKLSANTQAPVMITGLLSGQLDIVNPPKKGDGSFFKILPEQEVGLKEGWVESSEVGEEKSTTAYTLSAITDSTYVIDLKGSSNTITKAETMGTETITRLMNEFTGTIILDRTTGLIREKTLNTESHGTTEVMGGVLPVTSRVKVEMKVE